MRVKDIMETKFAMLEVDDGLDRILEAFSKKSVSSAPVFSKGELVGIVSYSDIARFFMAKDAVTLPFLESGGQQPEAKMNASSLARRPPAILTPDQPVKLALSKIVSSDCVPVMDGKKVVGLVRPEQVIDFFLAERAKLDVASQKKSISAKKAIGQAEEENSTAIDKVLEIVKRDGETSPKRIAKELGITDSTAEDLAKLLGKHSLVDVSYSFLSGITVRRIEHGSRQG